MLESMKNAVRGWVVRILVFVLVLSFATWFIADIFVDPRRFVVAHVGRTVISPDEFSFFFQRHLQAIEQKTGQQLDAKQAWSHGLVDQVLARLLIKATLDNDAAVLGLGVSKSVIAESILNDLGFKDSSGRFSRASFEQALAANNLSEERYFSYKKREHIRNHIIQSVVWGAVVPGIYLESFHKFSEEERRLAFTVITSDMVGSIATPDAKTLSNFFSLRKQQFQVPEYRTVELIQLTPDDLIDSVSVTSDELESEYESSKNLYSRNERRKIQHLIFGTIEEAQAAAKRIGGSSESFRKLAHELQLSDEDIDLGSLEKEEFIDPALAESAFSLNSGEISAPVEGNFGFSILHLVAIEPATVRSLGDVSDELRAKLALRAAKNKILDFYDQIEDERASGSKLSDIAKKFSLPYRVIQNVDTNGRDQERKEVSPVPAADRNFFRLVFQIPPETEAEPISLEEGGFVWFNIQAITESRLLTFDEAKEDVVNLWHQEELNRQLARKSHEFLSRLEQGDSFESLVESIGGKLFFTPSLKRNSIFINSSPEKNDKEKDPDSIWTYLSEAAIDSAFITPLNHFGVSEDPSGVYRIIFHVRHVEVPAFDPKTASVQALLTRLSESIGSDNIDAYVNARQHEFGSSVNKNVISRLID